MINSVSRIMANNYRNSNKTNFGRFGPAELYTIDELLSGREYVPPTPKAENKSLKSKIFSLISTILKLDNKTKQQSKIIKHPVAFSTINKPWASIKISK